MEAVDLDDDQSFSDDRGSGDDSAREVGMQG